MFVDLPAKARKRYDQLENDLIALFDEGEVTAFNAGSLSTKLRQCANGGVYTDIAGDPADPERVDASGLFLLPANNQPFNPIITARFGDYVTNSTYPAGFMWLFRSSLRSSESQ